MGLSLRRAEDLGSLWAEATAPHDTAPTTPATPAPGLDALLDHLDRGGRRARRAYGALGLRVRGARTWEPEDRRTPRWWPQGVSGAHDGPHAERGLLVTTWYSKTLDGENHGSRISVLDPRTGHHEHVLLVEPRRAADGSATFRPLELHAGGIVWWGPWLHVAATARGFATCHLDDLRRAPEAWRARTFGHDWVLPMRIAHRAETAAGTEPLRYSFLSLDTTDETVRTGAPALVVGEYGRGNRTRRLTRWPMDPDARLPAVEEDGRARPLSVVEGVRGMQGALRTPGGWLVSTSHGPGTPGSLWTGTDGTHGSAVTWRRRRWATPVGPEDLAVSGGSVWTVTEHPRRRWVVRLAAPR